MVSCPAHLIGNDCGLFTILALLELAEASLYSRGPELPTQRQIDEFRHIMATEILSVLQAAPVLIHFFCFSMEMDVSSGSPQARTAVACPYPLRCSGKHPQLRIFPHFFLEIFFFPGLKSSTRWVSFQALGVCGKVGYFISPVRRSCWRAPSLPLFFGFLLRLKKLRNSTLGRLPSVDWG